MIQSLREDAINALHRASAECCWITGYLATRIIMELLKTNTNVFFKRFLAYNAAWYRQSLELPGARLRVLISTRDWPKCHDNAVSPRVLSICLQKLCWKSYIGLETRKFRAVCTSSPTFWSLNTKIVLTHFRNSEMRHFCLIQFF